MAPEPLEFEIEAEPVSASHLLRVRCRGCGTAGAALAAPGQERNARCAECMGGSVVLPAEELGRYTPVLGDALVRSMPVELKPGSVYPSPVVSSVDDVEPCEGTGAVNGWPSPILKLEADARRLGWTTRRAYSRGSFAHGTTGKPLAERDVFSVRFARDTWQGYAIYTDKWASIFVAGADLPPFGKMNHTELGAWLDCPEREAGWYDAIRQRVADAEERNRQATRNRAKKGKSGQEGM